MALEKIQKVNDIKNLEPEDLDILAQEIREFLIDKVSDAGGHLASNLGVVELTMALHLAFELPKDKIIWDVGHQSYTHKLLTGRRDGFDDLRKFGGMSGFPKRKESDCDAFDTGHSSTSLSAGLGFVAARDIQEENYHVVSIIGDGSMTGGMAYEALNNAAQIKSNFIMVLNDNNMSISKNVGGMSNYLNGLRTAEPYTDLKRGVETAIMKMPGNSERIVKRIKKTKSGIKQLIVPGMFFEDMGITYLGPVDGHDVNQLYKVLMDAKRVNHAVIVHVLTQKGRGYEPAEQNPSKFHGTGPFVIETGKPKVSSGQDSYTEVFSKVLCDIARNDQKVTAITAAMADGTGLSRFAKMFPKRFFDVGIAEEHAVTFAAGQAAGGLKPVVALYSSFLQRAYDQIVHDVCIQKLPVVFAVDRAGLVGSDGETHQGLLDMAFLSTIPNMTVLTPKNRWELADMLRFAIEFDGPIALRYPRGTAYEGLKEFRAPVKYGESEVIYREKEIAVLSVGHMAELADAVRSELKENGYPCTLVNVRFVKPLDKKLLCELAKDHSMIVTIEEGTVSGGFGQHVLDYTSRERLPLRVCSFGINDEFIEHGSVDVLRKSIGLDQDTITQKIITEYLMGKD